MTIKAYAKVNLILNVLGTRPDGYHEVRMLMQAISLADDVTVDFADALLTPADFEYGENDLAWRAALLMAETFRPELVTGGPLQAEQNANAPLQAEQIAAARINCAAPAIRGVSISIEKYIPAAAGLAGGSSDAAAVMVGLAKLWNLVDSETQNAVDPAEQKASDTAAQTAALLEKLLPLGAKLGSDVPFCIGAALGKTSAIATGTGIQLQFVEPLDCGITLYFSDRTIPNKTRAVYAELTDEDCRPVYDIEAFLAAGTLAEKRSLMGNHLQAPAERLMERCGIARPEAAQQPDEHASHQTDDQSADLPLLCGAGPTYFSIGKDGPYRTVTG